MTKVLLLLFPVLATVGIGGVLAGKGIDLAAWVLLVCFVAALILFWASLTAGMALVKSQRPSVTIGQIELDTHVNPAFSVHGVFYVNLVNGDTPLTPVVQIVEVIGGNKPLGHGVNGHWRERGERILLPGEPQQFGLLALVNWPSGNPGIIVWGAEYKDEQEVKSHQFFLTKDLPINQQGPIGVKVNVLYRRTIPAEKDKPERQEIIKLMSRVYNIVPEPHSQIKYRIVG